MSSHREAPGHEHAEACFAHGQVLLIGDLHQLVQFRVVEESPPVAVVAFHAARLTTLDPNALVNLAGAVFIAPFVLLSATSGLPSTPCMAITIRMGTPFCG